MFDSTMSCTLKPSFVTSHTRHITGFAEASDFRGCTMTTGTVSKGSEKRTSGGVKPT